MSTLAKGMSKAQARSSVSESRALAALGLTSDEQEIFMFGKHRGKTFGEVVGRDRGYCERVLRISSPSGQDRAFALFLKASGKGFETPPGLGMETGREETEKGEGKCMECGRKGERVQLRGVMECWSCEAKVMKGIFCECRAFWCERCMDPQHSEKKRTRGGLTGDFKEKTMTKGAGMAR